MYNEHHPQLKRYGKETASDNFDIAVPRWPASALPGVKIFPRREYKVVGVLVSALAKDPICNTLN